jgi:lysophospholipase L1-like esterase
MSTKKVAFASLLALGALAGAEVAARVALAVSGIPWATLVPATVKAGEPHPTLLYEDPPFLPYALRPSLDVWMNPVERAPIGAARERWIDVRTNAWGGRGGEVAMPKPPGAIRIAAIGGSTTFGWTREEWAWTTQLAAILEPSNGGTSRIEVLNFGTPKATSVFSLVVLATKVIHLDPDVVVVYHGINDVSSWRFEGLRPDHGHLFADLRRVPRWVESIPGWAFRSALVTAVAHATALRLERNLGERTDLVPLSPPERFDTREGIEILLANYRSMDGICRAHGARFVTATFHVLREDDAWGRSIVALNDALRAWASAADVPLADLAAEIPHDDPTFHVDGAHFTPKGERAVARILAETLRREVLPRLDGSE